MATRACRAMLSPPESGGSAGKRLTFLRMLSEGSRAEKARRWPDQGEASGAGQAESPGSPYKQDVRVRSVT